MPDAILTLNAGSSSIKFALFEIGATLLRIAAGEVENIGAEPYLFIQTGGSLAFERRWPHGEALTHEDLLGAVLDWVDTHLGDDSLIATGHRIVHGGAEFIAPVRLTAETLAELDELTPLAPLHQPHNLAGVRAVLALRPHLPQIASFDTAFHHTSPEIAQTLCATQEFL